METLEFTKPETALVKIESNQLDEVVKNSGLAIQEGEEIKKSYLPFLESLAEVQAQASKINFDNPAPIDETIARELRLRTVKIRTGSAALKDERKRTYLLRGNLEQAAYNLIKASCELTEDVFAKVEKARELAERKRKEQLRLERSEKLSPYTEAVSLYPLGEMSEEQFSELYSGLRTAHENKLEAEKKAEEERIAKEKAEAAEKERIKQENIRLQKEAEEREKQIAAEREKARIEQEKRDKAAEIERKKQAQILADQKAKADKERAELAAKAEAERKEKERLEAELEAKKEAEEKAKREELARIEAEKKARAAAERKAKLAPDKNKLLAFGQALNDVPRPEIKSIEAAQIMANINGLLAKLNNYIVENANKL
jgi:hypothetical protein